MNLNKIKHIYFIGIGGIGMSSIARFFNILGKNIAGYDLTKTTLTSQLEDEGIDIHYQDDIEFIPNNYKKNSLEILIIYTPAIPIDNSELNYFRKNNYKILKRAEILGIISRNFPTIAIAGTHGKTTVTSITAHILRQNNNILSGFLGGISNNYNSNLIIDNQSIKYFSNKPTKENNSEIKKYVVLEADEFDKSFLNFYPEIALITSTDKDHLDIYENKANIISAFEKFLTQTHENGIIILNKKLNLKIPNNRKCYTYSLTEKADFYAKNIRIHDTYYYADIVCPNFTIKEVKFGMHGIINVENAIAAIALSSFSGVSAKEIKKAVSTFSGVKRRFDIQILTKELIYIDDYAHHPEEIKALINSVKKTFPEKKITAIFQPHLYSRTQDFAEEFAESLELIDDIILTEIYPAREKPIYNVTSKIIIDRIKNKNKILCQKNELIDLLKNKKIELLLTIGAGDIDKEVEKIKKFLNQKLKNN